MLCLLVLTWQGKAAQLPRRPRGCPRRGRGTEHAPQLFSQWPELYASVAQRHLALQAHPAVEHSGFEPAGYIVAEQALKCALLTAGPLHL